ncbi:hypothetical protein EBT31_12765 [bacterium]|nr:hypothetical protein [bacterium]
MPYPTLRPASRNFDPGDWPVKTFRSQSGVEVRILYGSQRTGLKLDLSYPNITDTQAEQFLTHFTETLGTLRTFSLPAEARAGWTGTASSLNVPTTQAWRYAQPPAVTAVRPGISTVTISLVGVL